MKKLIKFITLFLILVIAILALTGCVKKDEKEAAKPAIVASWKYDGAEYTYTFNSDGTGIYDTYGTKRGFTYTTNEDNISILYNGTTVPFETKYSINGDTLNILDSFGNDTLYKKVK